MIQKKLSYTYALVNFEITTRFENNNVSVKFIIFVFVPGKSSAVRTGVLGAVPDVRKAGGGEAVGQVSPVMKGWVRWPEGGVSAPAPGWCGISEGLL